MNLSSSPVDRETNRSTVSFSRYARGILSRPLTATAPPTAAPDRTGTELLSSSLGAPGRNLTLDNPHQHPAGSDGQHSPTTPGLPSAKLVYECDAPLNAFAASTNGSFVAVAGRESLKVLEVGYHDVRDVCDLTAGSDRHSSTNDVKWGIGPTATLLATAHSNGTVTTWNVDRQRSGRQASISGHGRAINRVAFNPGNGNWLLTASQDGNMRLWDLRERNGSARFSLVGRAEAVRDVQFNAANALELAAVFDSGVLQRWDLRRPNSFEAKVNAHNGPALSVDWHADGVHLATGGRDKVIKIWNAKGDLKRPVHYICTMAPVSRTVWRAGDVRHHWDIASCSLNFDTAIHVWNLRRPHLPIRTIEQHDGTVTGLLWRNDETLWSCSKDRSFRQHPVSLAPNPADSIAHLSTAWHPSGELAVSIGSNASDRYREKQAARGLLLSRAGSDASLEGRRSRENLVDAAPLAQGAMHFDPLAHPFRPVQTQATVEAVDLSDDIFKFMAVNYRLDKADPLEACQHNALVATECGRHETARCWRMLRLALAQAHRRLAESRPVEVAASNHPLDRLSASHITLRPSSPAVGTSLIMPRYTDRPAHDSPSLTRRHDSDSSSEEKYSGEGDGQDDAISEVTHNASTLRRGSLAESRYEEDESALSRVSSRDMSMSSADDSNSYGSYYGVSALEEVLPRSGSFLPDDGPAIFPTTDKTSSATTAAASVVTLQPPAQTAPPASDSSDLTDLKELIAQDDRPWTLAPLLVRFFRHYRDLADAQTAVTIAIVFDDLFDGFGVRDRDETVHAYVDLLHRRRLFAVAAEVVSRARSEEKIVARYTADVVLQLTCQRCMKAAPFTGIRQIPATFADRTTTDEYWHCSRCQNTVLCTICETSIKGECAHCPACGHSAHLKCAVRWRHDVEAQLVRGGAAAKTDSIRRCVVPSCDCECVS